MKRRMDIEEAIRIADLMEKHIPQLIQPENSSYALVTLAAELKRQRAELKACKSELTTLLKISACPAESHEPEEGDTETIKRFRQICKWMHELNAGIEASRLPKVTDAKDLIVGEWYWWDGDPYYSIGVTGEKRLNGVMFLISPSADTPAYGPIPRPKE